MKIAVPYENGQVFPHFGHAPQFKFYTIESGMILHTEVVETAGSGHSAVTAFLMRGGVDTLIYYVRFKRLAICRTSQQ